MSQEITLTSEQKARMEFVCDHLKSAYDLIYDAHDLITDIQENAYDGLDVADESNDDNAHEFFMLALDSAEIVTDLLDALCNAIRAYEEHPANFDECHRI